MNTKEKPTPALTEKKIFFDLTVSTGFVSGILFCLIFLILFWYISTVSKDSSKIYQKMLCDYIVF